MNIYTAQQIADRACNELGLPTTTIEPSMAEQSGRQILAVMNSLGEDILRVHDWQEHVRMATITGDGVTDIFDLPDDFGRIINQTAWNSSDRLPLIGPATFETWGWLNFGIVSSSVFFRYRLMTEQFRVYPTPGVGEVFNFYYITKDWVASAADGTVFQSSIQVADDIPLFDRTLMIKGLKLRLWEQKGFDTTHLANEFNFFLEALKGQSQGAAKIDLARQDLGFLIDPIRNIPEGGW